MISESARQSVNEIFTRAVTANLPVNAGDQIRVERLADQHAGDLPGGNIVVLTISSYLFRLLTIFHVDPDGSVGNYFKRGDAVGSFAETFGEIGNLCCGAMNRELGNHFSHLGMSTPHMLRARCADHLKVLRPGYTARHRIDINGEISLHATLCLCAYAPIDFRAMPPDPTMESGSIELF